MFCRNTVRLDYLAGQRHLDGISRAYKHEAPASGFERKELTRLRFVLVPDLKVALSTRVLDLLEWEMVVSDELIRILRKHTCLYASFDNSIDADLSRGDAQASTQTDVVRHDPQAGRFGGSLVFTARDHAWAEDEFHYTARGNFPYCESSFDGTISVWLCGDPDADLSPEYPVDPFHVSRHAADASFYLDLTRPNDWRYGSPRKLRFGFYSDSPEQNMFVGGQLIVAGELGWNDRGWHHVVATWCNANSGSPNGAASLYIDGELRGTMEGYEHRVTWDLANLTIGLGQRYVGRIDELLIAEKALSPEKVGSLYQLGQTTKLAL